MAADYTQITVQQVIDEIDTYLASQQTLIDNAITDYQADSITLDAMEKVISDAKSGIAYGQGERAAMITFVDAHFSE